MERIPRGGCLLLDVFRTVPLAIKVLKALVSKYHGSPEAGTEAGTVGARK